MDEKRQKFLEKRRTYQRLWCKLKRQTDPEYRERINKQRREYYERKKQKSMTIEQLPFKSTIDWLSDLGYKFAPLNFSSYLKQLKNFERKISNLSEEQLEENHRVYVNNLKKQISKWKDYK